MILSAGCVVEFFDKTLSIALVMNHVSGKVRLLLPTKKETTISDKRILSSTSRALCSLTDKEECHNLLVAKNNLRDKISYEIDLVALHELLIDEIREYSLTELAGYLFTKDDDDSIAALLRALVRDKVYFKNKQNLYTPTPPEEIEKIKIQVQQNEERKLAETAILTALQTALEKGHFSENLEEHLSDFINYVAKSPKAISRNTMSLLEKAQLTNPRRLFRMLTNSKKLDPDENLLFIKHGISDLIEYPDKDDIAEIITNSPQIEHRKNLTDLKTWAIDGSDTKDRDDAFSFCAKADKFSLYIHIADVAEHIKNASKIDLRARSLAETIYLPDGNINLLPPTLSEETLSLNQGAERLALTIEMDFDFQLNCIKTEICESIVKVDYATCYEDADRLLNTDQWLQEANNFSQLLRKKRIQLGAIDFPNSPELLVKVNDSKIELVKTTQESITQKMIAEFMIWANHKVAEWTKNKGIPFLYREQEMSEAIVYEFDSFEPVSFYREIKKFKKGSLSLIAARHTSLGFDSYTQVSSPLRRYLDLILHRQIKSFITSTSLAYTEEELKTEMIIYEDALLRTLEIAKMREKYYVCKYLKEQNTRQAYLMDAKVVDQNQTDVTFYIEQLCTFKYCRKPNFETHIGQKVKVVAKQIDTFDCLVRFDLVQG